MKAKGAASFFLTICFLVCCTAQENITVDVRPIVTPQFQALNNNINKTITADIGDNITLPCQVPDIYKPFTSVECRRPDKDPKLVFFYRNEDLDPHNQHPSFQNRVYLQDNEMKNGNFSPTLMNVTMEDTGKYEFRVFQETKNKLICSFFLKVRPPAQTNIRAEVGKDVILPCKVPDNININNIRAVEWSRPGLDPDFVLLYRDGRLDPDNQHPSYKNRVDLQDQMKVGNIFLNLTNVMMNDTGTYECRVFEIGNNDPICIFNLEVHLSGNQDRVNKDGFIAGSGLGVIGGLLAVVVICVLVYKRCMKKNSPPSSY